MVFLRQMFAEPAQFTTGSWVGLRRGVTVRAAFPVCLQSGA
jgi:hypothetical protein